MHCERLLTASVAERHSVKCRCTDPLLEIANATILLPPTNQKAGNRLQGHKDVLSVE